jgi:hypothetical protein
VEDEEYQRTDRLFMYAIGISVYVVMVIASIVFTIWLVKHYILR